jgi:hypothetical protein
MSDGAIQGLTAEQAAAVWQSARELVAWADLVAVSGRRLRQGRRVLTQRRRGAKKARKAVAA